MADTTPHRQDIALNPGVQRERQGFVAAAVKTITTRLKEMKKSVLNFPGLSSEEQHSFSDILPQFLLWDFNNKSNNEDESETVDERLGRNQHLYSHVKAFLSLMEVTLSQRLPMTINLAEERQRRRNAEAGSVLIRSDSHIDSGRRETSLNTIRTSEDDDSLPKIIADLKMAVQTLHKLDLGFDDIEREASGTTQSLGNGLSRNINHDRPEGRNTLSISVPRERRASGSAFHLNTVNSTAASIADWNTRRSSAAADNEDQGLNSSTINDQAEASVEARPGSRSASRLRPRHSSAERTPSSSSIYRRTPRTTSRSRAVSRSGVRNTRSNPTNIRKRAKTKICPYIPCKFNKEGFYTNNDLKRHINTKHHKTLGFVCPSLQCRSKEPKIWDRLDRFRKHMMTHRTEDWRTLFEQAKKVNVYASNINPASHDAVGAGAPYFAGPANHPPSGLGGIIGDSSSVNGIHPIARPITGVNDIAHQVRHSHATVNTYDPDLAGPGPQSLSHIIDPRVFHPSYLDPIVHQEATHQDAVPAEPDFPWPSIYDQADLEDMEDPNDHS